MSENEFSPELTGELNLIVNRLSFKVFGGAGFDRKDNIGFRICNISSFCFYTIQGLYAIYILYRLSWRTKNKPKRSCSLIVAVVMILYSSIALAVLFGDSKLTIKAQDRTEKDRA